MTDNNDDMHEEENGEKAIKRRKDAKYRVNLQLLKDSLAQNRRADYVCMVCCEYLIDRYGDEVLLDNFFEESLNDPTYALAFRALEGIREIQDMTDANFSNVVFGRHPIMTNYYDDFMAAQEVQMQRASNNNKVQDDE